jgi:hypothetical protein
VGDEDPSVDWRPAGQGAAITQNRSGPEGGDDGVAVVTYGVLGRHGGADHVDARRHPHRGGRLRLTGEAGLVLRSGQYQFPSRVLGCPGNR